MTGPPDFVIAKDAIISSRPCGHPLTDQVHVHKSYGLDRAANSADPFLAFVEGIVAVGDALLVQHPGFGAVITRQVVTVRRTHQAKAPAFINGRITELQEEANGVSFATLLLVTDEAGEPFADMTTTMLLIDPAKPPREKPAPKTRPAPDTDSTTAEIIGRHSFTPDASCVFERDTPTPHNDPEIARAMGFAKPIVSGNQVFSIIWKRFIELNHPLPVRMSFTLKRPIFWDEEIYFAQVSTGSNEREIIEVRNTAGKTAIACEITSLTTPATDP